MCVLAGAQGPDEHEICCAELIGVQRCTVPREHGNEFDVRQSPPLSKTCFGPNPDPRSQVDVNPQLDRNPRSQLEDVYSEIYRVLKPGALFASYEWVATAKFDPNDAEHVRIMDDINYGNGPAGA